jgi:hypothetical protein
MAKTNKTRKVKQRKGTRALRGGDIPPPAMHTYHTASCLLPRVTEQAVVRGVQTTNLIAQAASGQAPTFYFSLANASVTSGYWDQYKLAAIRFTITPDNNAIGLVTNSSTTLVPIYCVIDYDDDTALGSATAAAAYSNCVVIHPGESCERIFQPHMALAAYAGAFTSYANVAPTWIDAASSGVRHYGVKLYIPGATALQTLLQSWEITVEYFLEFRKSI